jgi:hypothetical protein
MAFTFVFYENADLFAESFPAPATSLVVKTVEAAEAPVMEALVQEALNEVTALNALIAAAFPDEPGVLLTLADADLAGAGDGHTFVTTLIFVPSDLNGIQEILDTGALTPDLFQFKFGLASEDESFATEINAAITRGIGEFDMPAIFQFTRGAAKGTRFMFGVGGTPEGGGEGRLGNRTGLRAKLFAAKVAAKGEPTG